ncbi:MAG: hypothetical protein JXO22_06605 [Phycisphaerae bacterium]|nr:hypothetical protein [Phycisphaerae bacterium]
MEWFFITFELAHATPADYESVYTRVHAEGGYRYRTDEEGSWGRLPGTTVALPMAVSNPEVARIAFELKLAHLDLIASAIIVARGEVAFTLQRVEYQDLPSYVRATDEPMAVPGDLQTLVI